MLNTIGFRKDIVILFLLALGSVTVNATVAMVDSSLRLELRPSEIRPIICGSMDVGKGLFNLLDVFHDLLDINRNHVDCHVCDIELSLRYRFENRFFIWQ